MSAELWVEGVIIEFKDGKPCNRAMVRRVGKHEIVIADIQDGATYRVEQFDLNEKKQRGELRFLAEVRDFGDLSFIDLSEKEQREVNRRFKYIRGLKENGIAKITEKNACNIIKEIAKKLGEKSPHWQSVRSWNKSFIEAGQKMRGLYPRHRYKGSRESKIDDRVVEIINRESSRYFKLSQPTIASIVRNIEAKIIDHNLSNPESPLKAPTFLTIQKRIQDKSYQNKQKSRKGKRTLAAELAGSDSGIVTSRVLERVEIDHTQLDIHVLHDDHKTLLGRPFITVLIDHHSHMVLGFQMSFENPSFASVCMACMNAFLPKDDFISKMKCDSSWPAHGIPSTLVTDNGNEFWGRHFASVADELGPIFQYCPIRKGNYKSKVERFFGMVNSLVLDDLPGVVRKPGKCGEGYDARQEAKITFTEFKRYFTNWLTEIYHNSPIDETGMTPNELWVQSEDDLPIPFENEMELIPILMATTTRELSGGGIKIFSLNYDSAVLKDIYRRDGPCSVTAKYNPFDIGSILVLDDHNKTYLKVDCARYSYASGLSEFENKKIREEARRNGQNKLEDFDLQRAKVKLAEERDELHARNMRRKTQVTVSKAARSEQIGVESPRLVIDNTKNITVIAGELDEELDLDGWEVE
ncbi:MAG: Integrase/transposase family protein [Verrucomicrobiaceae bacterium]|nr:Integrase/transposase family protein [Verrucomicrobiaceae bacterium]